jgi:hypothetical protein
MKTESLEGKIRDKIGFLGGEKETQRVGREIFSKYLKLCVVGLLHSHSIGHE